MKIKHTNIPNDGEVGLMEMSATYIQNPDCLQDADADDQTLTITAVMDLPSDKEGDMGGFFLRIKTDCWTFDDTGELAALVNDFTNRLMTENDGKEETK